MLEVIERIEWVTLYLSVLFPLLFLVVSLLILSLVFLFSVLLVHAVSLLSQCNAGR
jgi:hypothetical protein